MFSIIVTDALTGCKTELCRVGSNPGAIAEAAKDKTIRVGKRKSRRYCAVEIVKRPAQNKHTPEPEHEHQQSADGIRLEPMVAKPALKDDLNDEVNSHCAREVGTRAQIEMFEEGEPITPPAPAPETERRQRIELINRHIAAEGFAPKDFFLTQTPPEKVDALARRKTRERRRRPIARRMARWGLTAHDLAPVSVPRKPPAATADLVSPAASATANAKGETAMANIDDFYPSKFLRASDLKGKEITVTIDRVEAEEFEQDGVKRPKPVVHFRNNGLKALVLNKTNSTRIATALGNKDTDAWTGKQVRLFPDMEEFKGQVHEVVRVRRAPAPIGEDLNDEVPNL